MLARQIARRVPCQRTCATAPARLIIIGGDSPSEPAIALNLLGAKIRRRKIQIKVVIEPVGDGNRDGNRGELWRTLANGKIRS